MDARAAAPALALLVALAVASPAAPAPAGSPAAEAVASWSYGGPVFYPPCGFGTAVLAACMFFAAGAEPASAAVRLDDVSGAVVAMRWLAYDREGFLAGEGVVCGSAAFALPPGVALLGFTQVFGGPLPPLLGCDAALPAAAGTLVAETSVS